MAVAHRVGEPLEFDGYVDDFERNVSAMQFSFEGYADDYDKAIVAMEFSLDGGTTWTRHATEGAQAGRVLSWTFVYTPERPGRYLLKVRAVDGDGTVSDIVAEYAFEVES